MKKAIMSVLIAGSLSVPAFANHTTGEPAEGFKNYGQCNAYLVHLRNDARKSGNEELARYFREDVSCQQRSDGNYEIRLNP